MSPITGFTNGNDSCRKNKIGNIQYFFPPVQAKVVAVEKNKQTDFDMSLEECAFGKDYLQISEKRPFIQPVHLNLAKDWKLWHKSPTRSHIL